jgi:hypothetical protein
MELIEIMNILGVKRLVISRDFRGKYAFDAKAREILIRAAGRLAATLRKNGMTYDLSGYQPPEQARVITLARELLQAGTV